MEAELVNWLNNKVRLDKPVTDINTDFKSGFLFAKVLEKLDIKF